MQLDGLGFAKPIADTLAAASALGAPAYMAFMPLLASLAAGLFTAALVWPLIERLALSVVDAPAVAVDMSSELLRKRRKALAGARLTT
ncbi:hypothetical protein D3C71_19320 [compost metagenome]